MKKGELNRDFGRGFYVTNIYEQAKYWAKRKGKKQKNDGVITEFNFFESAFTSDYLKTLRFKNYSEKWLDFVVMNRQATPNERVLSKHGLQNRASGDYLLFFNEFNYLPIRF